MSSELTPAPHSQFSPLAPTTVPPMAWEAAPQPDAEEGALSIMRYVHAIVRYKWLIALLTLVGAAGGYAATRFVRPEYETGATIWIAAPAPPKGVQTGPIRAEELLASTSWNELFRSFTIVDSVVAKLHLYVTPERPEDTPLFASLSVAPRLRTGEYVLSVDSTGKRYSLTDRKSGRMMEQGAVGDSIGRGVGMLWQPDTASLRARRSVRFAVTTPRGASGKLLTKVSAEQQLGSNFMRLRLTGDDPAQTAEILNLWVREFVNTAAELKRRNLTEFSRILQEQLDYANRQLREAEISLETFRVNAITQPSENSFPGPGLEQTRDPVFSAFFNQKVEYDNVRRDRTALERMLADIRAGREQAEVLSSIPGLLTTPGAQTLNSVMQDLYTKEAELRTDERLYTDQHPTIKSLQAQIQTLRSKTIPDAAADVLARMQQRENDLSTRIDGESKEIRGIPTRTIEEMRLRRAVNVAEALFTSLQNRYEEAKLAEASSVPDVTALDMASAPDAPIADTKYRIFGMGIAAGLGLAIALVLLLDRLDHRFRYPEQVTGKLRLPILGTVPTLRQGRRRDQAEAAAQIVESFRGIRLRLQQAHPPGDPIVCTITSANEGDGKSMISANLALSLAEAGYRTLLIDGDTRRGTLHSLFQAERRPGLIECLTGAATLHEVTRPTSEARLTLIPCGGRSRRNPEIVASAALPQLLAMLRREYDAIVVDSPPLGAGIDAFALATACGNAMIVLRHGRSDLRMAELKMDLLRQLPVRTHGAILNEIEADGPYRYYSYSAAYKYGRTELDELGVPAPAAGGLIERG